MNRLLTAMGLLGIVTASALCDDLPAKLENPLGGIQFQIKFGQNTNYVTSKSDRFYSITYKGETLFSKGSEGTIPSLGGKNPIDFGDQPLSIAFDRGQTTVGGTLVTTKFAKPIMFGAKSDSSRLRVLIGYDGQLVNATQSTTSIGAEYMPLKPTERFLKCKSSASDIESFIAAGVVSQEHSMAGATTSTGAAFVRGRIGFASNFVVSNAKIARVEREANLAKNLKRSDISLLFSNLSPEMKNVRAAVISGYADAIGPARGPEARQKLREKLASQTDEEFVAIRDKVAAAYEDHAKALREAVNKGTEVTVVNPYSLQWSLFSEFESFYDLGTLQAAGRYRAAYSLNFRYNLSSKTPDNGYFSFKYINGFTQAEPTTRANGLILSFGVGF